eukprot:1697267-Karenia_brevis.AAC.1
MAHVIRPALMPLMKSLAALILPNGIWSGYELPTVADICKSIKCAKDNTPGFDGIPKSARKN